MRVELLYFDGCPNWEVAEGRLTDALGDLGRGHVMIQRRRLETLEEAEELHFFGSPTIRIDGHDPFAQGSEQVGWSCRLYRTPAGLSGAPTTAQLLQVLS